MIQSWLAERVLDYLAFARWNRGKYRLAQIASLLLDGAVVRSVYGPLLHCRFADSTFWLAARYGNDEVMNLLADLGPSDGFVDVGANIGLTTCFAASRGAVVLSFEPSSREFTDLVGNTQLLNLEGSPPPPPYACLLRPVINHVFYVFVSAICPTQEVTRWGLPVILAIET